jgi:hypothetical protein
MAQSFATEEDIVKLQIVSLAAKLYLTNSKQTKLLTQYVLNLAKYDQNYDIRDRARLVRCLLLTKDSKLHKHSRDIFLMEKPAPNLVSAFEGGGVKKNTRAYMNLLRRPFAVSRGHHVTSAQHVVHGAAAAAAISRGCARPDRPQLHRARHFCDRARNFRQRQRVGQGLLRQRRQ